MYSPAEDSYLLQKNLKNYLENIKNKKIKILDMGSGSGIQYLTCKNLGFNNLLSSDIDEEVIKKLKKQKINIIKSDLFSNIKDKFDLIIFNPPYLPENKYDKEIDTCGGKKGYEIILEFLKQAKNHLKKQARILLLFSSFSKPNIIKKQARLLGYNLNLLSKKRFFFETLYVYELEIK